MKKNLVHYEEFKETTRLIDTEKDE